MVPSRPRETMFDYQKGVDALLTSGSVTGRAEAHNATEEILATTNNTGIGQIPRPDASKLANSNEGHKRKRKVDTSTENDVHNFRNIFVPYEPSWTMHKLICAIREKTHSFMSIHHQTIFEDLITKKEYKLSKLRSLIITWAPRVMNRELKRYEVTIASNYIAENLLRKN